MKINLKKAVLAGILGTVAMTIVATFGAPMMGMGLFSGAAALAFGSLIGHLVYGAIVGAVYSSTKESCRSCVAS